MARNKRPLNAELISTYEKLRFYANKFGDGFYNCLIIIGPPGTFKSTIIHAATRGNAHVISGHSSPYQVFCEIQDNIDRLLIIDDSDGLYQEKSGQRLLKSLTNPVEQKTVCWTTNKPISEGRATKFVTRSRVCIIDNAWNSNNDHLQALEDRSRLMLFDPKPLEVHQELKRMNWFNDIEIYDFISEHLRFFKNLSGRTYVKAKEAKNAGEDWRSLLLNQVKNDFDKQLLLVETDPNFANKPVHDRCMEWISRTNGSRASYFNRKRALLSEFDDAQAI